VKYHKGRNKAIKILNTKISTDPYKIAIFPVGIPFSLQKPKNPYCRNFSLRVATLLRLYGAPFVKILYLTDLAQKVLSLRRDSYICTHSAISAQR